MKTLKSMTLLFFATIITMSFAQAQSVDVANSNVTWKGYKVTGKHHGAISIKEGTLIMKEGKLRGGNIVIDMTSLVVSDLDGKMKGKLEGHLKSSDFFSVDEFNSATLNLTKVVDRGPAGEYKVIGDLTIKGITKEIKFNVNTVDGKMVADLTIDRSDYNVRYGSGSFFDNLGDKTIYDEFELSASISFQ